ncbi:DUF2330 domain-containing protein [Haliangium sp.]|uniref:DUF2330 domain-containing protein n=1 Tax=Haliangium sp. TaxID=2663208 RepID=UPI003D0BE732
MQRLTYARVAALLLGAAGLHLVSAVAAPSVARACGCFAQSNPATPVIQGGERIVFAMEDGEVTAHIQIQYSGAAEDFAWLVPLPSMPTMELGVDELFTQLIQQTQPSYRWFRTGPECPFSGGGSDAGVPPPPPPPPPPSGPGSPVVEQGSVGPYAYTVLAADDKQLLSNWLAEEGYFVPTNGDEALDPYIRPGAFFLALKLRTGETVGDLQPIVVRYRSELPQIPIVLTSVGAERDMPVMVWMLGDSRAIPRNYYHTHINDALIDWLDNGANYVEVVTAAVDEADGAHSFVTEYAGSSNRMLGLLDPEWRFGDVVELRAIDEPIAYIEFLTAWQYQVSPLLFPILEEQLPIPAGLEEAVGYEISYPEFYFNARNFAEANPELFADAFSGFDPDALTTELDERIVTPTRDAGQLFRDHAYMTRLFTTLSPEEMNMDPVFSFNPDLPEVSNVHSAELRLLECLPGGGRDDFGAALLVTEQGWRLFLPEGRATGDWPGAPLPASQRIEVLREEGQAVVMVDNAELIEDGVNDYRPVPDPLPSPEPPDPTNPPSRMSGGCTAGTGAGGGVGGLLLLLGLALQRRRRR